MTRNFDIIYSLLRASYTSSFKSSKGEKRGGDSFVHSRLTRSSRHVETS